MTYQSKIYVFVSPKEVQFMKQFFVPSYHDWGYVEDNRIKTKPIRFFVSGGDCNPIQYLNQGA